MALVIEGEYLTIYKAFHLIQMTAQQFRPTFSTSQAKAEQKKAEREERYQDEGRGYVADNAFGDASSVFPEVQPQPKE